MWTWLRSWFAWRFSLRRLVVAVVFLGAVVGLNMREVGPLPTMQYSSGPDAFNVGYWWGWPFPSLKKNLLGDDETAVGFVNLYSDFACSDWVRAEWKKSIPWTHQGYRLLNRPLLAWLGTGSGRIVCGSIDALFALTMLFLILFLRRPQRKAPEPVQSIPAPSRR